MTSSLDWLIAQLGICSVESNHAEDISSASTLFIYLFIFTRCPVSRVGKDHVDAASLSRLVPVLAVFSPSCTLPDCISRSVEMPYSAFSSNLAAISHLCGSWTTATPGPRRVDKPLGEASAWHQPRGIGGMGVVRVVDGTFSSVFLLFCPCNTVCSVEQMRKLSHPAYYFLLWYLQDDVTVK